MDLKHMILGDLLFFLKGLAVGLAVSVPMGPAAILCVNLTLERGIFAGLVAGFGITVADTFYGAIAGFGLTSLADFVFGWFSRLRLIGGLLLLALGVGIYMIKPRMRQQNDQNYSLIHTFFATFGVTLANPLILFVFAAVFAAVGLDNFSQDYQRVIFLILGIFSGSLLWWMLLCSTITILHGGKALTSMRWANKVSGLMIIGFGLYTLYGRF
jgi:threonine/homoserine/homoserine lactone efflux protein